MSIVCGFINSGDRLLNVSRIAGTVIDAVTGVVLQNLSSVPIGEGVEGGTEIAFEFVYTPESPETTMAQVGGEAPEVLNGILVPAILASTSIAGRSRRFLQRQA